MAYWKTTCEFKYVREMIDDGNTEGVLNALIKLCKKYAKANDDYADEFEDLSLEIECSLDDDDDLEDVVDYYLDEFYDLCDAARIWLTF